MAIDWAQHQVITRVDGDVYRELEKLKKLGVTAVKIFTTYKSACYFIEKEPVKEIFKACKKLELLVTIHAEDDDIIEENSKQFEGKPYPPELLPVIRSSEAEYKAIKDYGEIAGSLEPGTDADILIFDPAQETVFKNDKMHSAAGYTAYDGMIAKGKAETVILRGEIILNGGEFQGKRGNGKWKIPACWFAGCI